MLSVTVCSMIQKVLFVAASPLLAALSVGGAVSFPTVLLHQLKKNGTSIELDFDTASWIGSINGLAGIPSILMPALMQWRGRKFAFITACLINIVGWIIAYTATSAAAILVCESLHGLGSNSVVTVSLLCISEMVSPNNRDTYMQSYAVMLTFTMALNCLLTQYLHWKTISIIMGMPMLIALATASAWPESPYWLSLKGEYDKCEKVFTWLRGTDDLSKKELNLLIQTQKENAVTKKKQRISLKYYWNQIRRRDFYLPSFHMFVLQYLFYWSGTYVILIYSIELIQKTTQNENAIFYAGLIMNAIVFLGISLSVVLCRYYKKKTILLWCAAIVVITMFSAAVVNYLQSIGYISKDSILCLYCLIAYMIAIGIGMVPVAYPVSVQIMPVKHRGIGGGLIVICTGVLHSSSLKISPYLFFYINLWGTFLLFAVNSLFCGWFIWKYVPDTEDRTLQEIEQYYMTGKFDVKRHNGYEYEVTEPGEVTSLKVN